MADTEYFAGRVTQKAVIEREGKILVCRGIGDSVWEFPGGRLHAGEAPVVGLAREIKEELGIDLIHIKPLVVEPSFHIKSQTHQVFIAYHCGYEGEIKADPKEVEEMKWLTIEELQTLPMFDDCAAVKKALLVK